MYCGLGVILIVFQNEKTLTLQFTQTECSANEQRKKKATCTVGEVEGTRRKQHYEVLVKTAVEHGTCTVGEVEGTHRQQHYEALDKTADEHGTTLFKHI